MTVRRTSIIGPGQTAPYAPPVNAIAIDPSLLCIAFANGRPESFGAEVRKSYATRVDGN
jgi:hypothetical protein